MRLSIIVVQSFFLWVKSCSVTIQVKHLGSVFSYMPLLLFFSTLQKGGFLEFSFKVALKVRECKNARTVVPIAEVSVTVLDLGISGGVTLIKTEGERVQKH